MRRDISIKLIGFVVGLAVLTGCTPTGRSPEVGNAIEQYYMANYPPARAVIEPLTAKTNEDYALNNARLGSVALAEYDLRTAESALFRAYEVINSVGVNKGGRDVAAALVQEKLKVWKGEPFERAMCNFYLGLVYYMRHDYANARAAFENALFKLRDYGEKDVKEDRYREVESDFVLAHVMLAKCWQKLGEHEKAQDMFARVAKLRPDLAALADPTVAGQSNVLLVVDFGQGPAKVVEGDNSIVAFRPHPTQAPPLPYAQVQVDGQMYNLGGTNVPSLDLLSLAQDRRWQSIDTIRLVKSIAGTGLMAAGAYTASRHDHHGHHDNQAAGLAMIAAGALLKASATGDVRYWEMLPRTVYLLPLRLPPGKHEVTVTFGNTGMGQTWRGIEAPSQGEATYYIRMGRVNVPPRDWPPPAMGTGQADAAMGQQRISRSR